MERAEKIISFIKEELLENGGVEIAEDTSLFVGRVLNSLKLLALIDYIEETFNVEVNPYEVTIENVDTVEAILSFIDSKFE